MAIPDESLCVTHKFLSKASCHMVCLSLCMCYHSCSLKRPVLSLLKQNPYFYFHETKKLSYRPKKKKTCKVVKQSMRTMKVKFVSYSSNRRLVSRIYKEIKKLNSVLNAICPSNLFLLGSGHFVEEEGERL